MAGRRNKQGEGRRLRWQLLQQPTATVGAQKGWVGRYEGKQAISVAGKERGGFTEHYRTTPQSWRKKVISTNTHTHQYKHTHTPPPPLPPPPLLPPPTKIS